MDSATDWTADQIPDLTGRTALVTGGNSGIGLEAARAMAGRGASVVLACRDIGKAQAAKDDICSAQPDSHVECMELDLASLDSVEKFSEAYLSRHATLHMLCNNAGVMALPYRRTADGFEMQLGTNHLGHFALTGRLLERLLATPGARVVTVSSTAHKAGSIRFDDLHWERGYGAWRAYAQSKLANLLFTYELERCFQKHGADAKALACHPGYATTNLQLAGPRMRGSTVRETVMRVANRIFSQTAQMGALPTLYAATAPEARGGDYFGPDGLAETQGHPVRVKSTRRSHDAELAARLWGVSEELTGVRYADLD